MNDRTDLFTELFTIGQLSRRTGLTVRTIRFWSDIDLVRPTSRSAGGYRLYDAEAVARLDLVRTLREMGVDVETVRKVLTSQATLGEVLRTHVAALDAEIRVLRLRRAVLRSIAQRSGTAEELRLMHKLAKLSARERQQIIDEFVSETFRGLPESPIATAMRQMPAGLPDEPTAGQVDAWVELAELVSDPDFRERVRQMAVTGAEGSADPGPVDPGQVMAHSGGAVRDGVAPDSPAGQEILGRIIGTGLSARERATLADRIATFTDRRVERYWQLMGVLNGREPFQPATPAFEWYIAALRATRPTD